ncbi:ABC transporter permease [Patescibacteria group bacterium]|jgi:cell division transport system permease protein|nr:ABC transporter permease [Patescibacteria group bacterium]
MWTSFKRTVRSGFVGFWRNAFVSLAAIFVMMVTLFVVGSVLFLSQLLNVSLAQIQDKVDINVYFTTDAVPDEILALKKSLEALPEVEAVTYISREEALIAFEERHEGDETTAQAIEELGDNPLGATLRVRTKETSQYEGIAAFLDEQNATTPIEKGFIDSINYDTNKGAIDKLTAIINAIERVSFFATIILIVASILITFNTIRLAIYTSREEITVMRLVGAGNMFIRGPFILQGIMYGAVAAILTLLLFYPITLWLSDGTRAFFQLDLFQYYVQDFGHIFLVIMGSGIMLGMVSSILAIARYLRY